MEEIKKQIEELKSYIGMGNDLYDEMFIKQINKLEKIINNK